MDRGAWRATVHRIEKSQTQVKQLSTHTHTLVKKKSMSKRLSELVRECQTRIIFQHAMTNFLSQTYWNILTITLTEIEGCGRRRMSV